MFYSKQTLKYFKNRNLHFVLLLTQQAAIKNNNSSYTQSDNLNWEGDKSAYTVFLVSNAFFIILKDSLQRTDFLEESMVIIL